MSSQLNSKRHFLDNLVSLYMLWCDLQKFKPILQSNVIINILASKFVAWIQKHALSSSSFQISVLSTQIFCASHFKFVWKYAPPWIRSTWISEFFLLLYIISTQTIYVNQKLHTLSRFATLRAISNLFSFFLYTLYSLRSNSGLIFNQPIYSAELKKRP